MVKSAKNKIMEFKKCKKEPAFGLVKDKDGNIRIAVGNKVVSEKKFNNYEEAEKYIGTKPYELIFNIAMVVAQLVIGELNNEKEKTELEEDQKNS